ncbi:MAG: polysaccharide deacetylase family protein [Alphaproteobacteria bacterium]|nr:polysaccharide deacetylase family protein [Alphaproteobacteria bacterium]
MGIGFGKAIRGSASLLPAALLRPLGRPAAVFFHGVERRLDDSRVQSNHHDAAEFSAIARALKDNFDVLPLSELGRVLAAPERHPHALFLMADDGYANNLSEAAVILSEFNLPWTLFLSTWHIDTHAPNPVFVARLFCLFAPDAKYEIANLGVLSLGSDRRFVAEQTIARLRALDAPRADQAVAEMAAALGEARLAQLLARFRSDSFLTWNEVAALKARGVEIGAHAHKHWPMHAAQSPGYLRDQAALPRARIEAELGVPCRYFAYPFGNTADVCRAAWQAVRDAGYGHAFTTLSGSLDASANPFLMPRYGLQPRETRLASLVPALRMGNGRLRDWQADLSR